MTLGLVNMSFLKCIHARHIAYLAYPKIPPMRIVPGFSLQSIQRLDCAFNTRRMSTWLYQNADHNPMIRTTASLSKMCRKQAQSSCAFNFPMYRTNSSPIGKFYATNAEDPQEAKDRITITNDASNMLVSSVVDICTKMKTKPNHNQVQRRAKSEKAKKSEKSEKSDEGSFNIPCCPPKPGCPWPGGCAPPGWGCTSAIPICGPFVTCECAPSCKPPTECKCPKPCCPPCGPCCPPCGPCCPPCGPCGPCCPPCGPCCPQCPCGPCGPCCPRCPCGPCCPMCPLAKPNPCIGPFKPPNPCCPLPTHTPCPPPCGPKNK